MWRNDRELSLHPVIGEMPASRQIAELEPSLGQADAAGSRRGSASVSKLAPLTPTGAGSCASRVRSTAWW